MPLLYTKVGGSGNFHYILNAFSSAQAPEGLQPGTPLGMPSPPLPVFQFLDTFLPSNVHPSSHPFIIHPFLFLLPFYT